MPVSPGERLGEVICTLSLGTEGAMPLRITVAGGNSMHPHPSPDCDCVVCCLVTGSHLPPTSPKTQFPHLDSDFRATLKMAKTLSVNRHLPMTASKQLNAQPRFSVVICPSVKAVLLSACKRHARKYVFVTLIAVTIQILLHFLKRGITQ